METLYDKLRQYRDAGVCPMHMPGHKRDTARWQMENPYGLDITEIDGFDNLHDARGVLREAMDRAARLWGAEQTWFLVNGSSCGECMPLSERPRRVFYATVDVAFRVPWSW